MADDPTNQVEEPEPPEDPDEDEESDEDDEEEEEPENLGVFESFDYTDQPFVQLTQAAKNHLYELCRNTARRDLASRRMEVEQAWEAQLFERGYHYLFPRRGGGWQLFSQASGKTWAQMQGAQVFETNVYAAHSEILTSALTRDIPTVRFQPADPESDPDVTAAAAADEFKEIFRKSNDLKQVHSAAAGLMCTDGRVLFYTTYRLDGQRFGFEDDEDEGDSPVPEDEAETPKTKSKVKRKPRGREVVEVLGKLSHKVPIMADTIHDMDFVLAFWDMDESRAKAKFPWIEDKIHPGGGVGEIGIDRLSRINVRLALEGGYVTGDSFNREVTVTYAWLRPAAYYYVKDEEVRQEFFESFPDGCLAVYAADELAFVRNESMDDHLHVLQACNGHGANRRALMTSVLSIQKRINNWLDLLNDFFVRTVPTVWMDGEVFNVGALGKQNNVPGQRRPFLSVPGRQIQEMIYAEPLPQHQPELPQFIQLFFNDFAEMLSGALPSLFGAESNTDTVGGIAMQRDQALGRLGTPWSRLQQAAACYHRQAVELAARCRLARGQSSISWMTDQSTQMTIEVSDLKGNVLCYPEADSNFPETWIQRSSRVQMLMQEAPTSPIVTQIFSLPENLRLLKDSIGLKEFSVPQADSVDKQRGEFEILLKREPGPRPNPQRQQLEVEINQLEQQFAQTQQQMVNPEMAQQLGQQMQQLVQQYDQTPEFISSCPVAQDASEDHATEAQVCVDEMNSPVGRKLRHGNQAQQQAFANLHLHWQEHMTMVQKLTPPPQEPSRPVSKSVSVAVDRMPPPQAAQLLQQEYGIQASPQDFGDQDAAETEQRITERMAAHAPPVPQQGSAPAQTQAGGGAQ